MHLVFNDDDDDNDDCYINVRLFITHNYGQDVLHDMNSFGEVQLVSEDKICLWLKSINREVNIQQQVVEPVKWVREWKWRRGLASYWNEETLNSAWRVTWSAISDAHLKFNIWKYNFCINIYNQLQYNNENY